MNKEDGIWLNILNFFFDGGYSGSEEKHIYMFSDDITEGEVEKVFDEWYDSMRTDGGGFTEISEKEAEENGIDNDLSENG